jgi:hypothetical protein
LPKENCADVASAIAAGAQTGAIIASDDNWNEDQTSELEATNLAPAEDLESAIVKRLPPGTYHGAGESDGSGSIAESIRNAFLPPP